MARPRALPALLPLVAAALAVFAGTAAAQPGCRLFKNFGASAGASSILVAAQEAWPVGSARIVGAPPGAATLVHGSAPEAPLPLAAGAFAGSPAAGAWTLRGADANTAIPSWGLVLCAAPEVAASGGPEDKPAAPGDVKATPRAAILGNGPAAITKGPAPPGRGAIGFVKDAKDANKDLVHAGFLNALSYFQGLSALTAEHTNAALLAAADSVDAKTAAARAAVGSLGRGLLGAAADLRVGGEGLRGKIQSLREAGAADVAEKVEDLTSLTGSLAGAAGSVTSDVASVVGTAGEIIKRALAAHFGVYTTAEGLVKGQVDSMVASKVNGLVQLVGLATSSLDSIKAGKGPLVVRGVELNQAKLTAFATAAERVASALQAAPTPSALALGGFNFGRQALAASTSHLFSGLSRFQGMMHEVFPDAPGVAQMAGAPSGFGLLQRG